MNNNTTTKENTPALKETYKLPFKTREDQILLLKNFFKHGYSNLPNEFFPTMSTEEFQKAIKITYEKLHTTFQNTPSLVHWLHGGLFRNAEFIPMALLFIEWYERHPSNQDNTECNFREIYHFLYKLTLNQVPAPISRKSAQVLHTIITEVFNEAWQDNQEDLLTYCNEIFKYRRTFHRRVYQGKRKISEEGDNV